MSNKTISMGELSAAIQAELEDYGEVVAKGFRKNVKKVTADTVKQLKQASPRDSGEYASGWVSEEQSPSSSVIYNKKKGSLSHLLENGHAIATGGRVEAVPHIGRVERDAVAALEASTQELIKG